jgi:hypothetical protein
MISNQFTATSSLITATTVSGQSTITPSRTEADARPIAKEIPQRKTEPQLSSNDGEYFPAIPDEESIAAMAEAGSNTSENQREQVGPTGAYQTIENTSNRDRVGSLIDLFV